MGTRSLTFFYDDGMTTTANPMLAIYKQYDGYVEGFGRDIAEFLNSMTLTNGYTMDQRNGKFANGMGCLAAQFLAHVKNGIGDIYIMQPNIENDHGQEYTYYIHNNRITVEDYHGMIFDGTWAEFLNFVNSNKKEAA